MTGAVFPRIELERVSKRYPDGTLANDAVDLVVRPGEIHAIVGENGAGKSTVMKMLYGLERPSSGRIRLDGEDISFARPAEAIAAGIGLVPQHVELVTSFTVAENIVLGNEPRRGPWLDRKRSASEVAATALRFGLDIDVETPVSRLSIGAQQRVEILKTLHRGARIVLLDEPTAVLAPHETRQLFDALRRFATQGLTVVLITHKLAEVMAISDRYTVLCGGRVTGQGATADATADRIAQLIVARSTSPGGEPARTAASPRLSAEALVRAHGLTMSTRGASESLLDVSFDIAPGEVLGIAGVDGNGQGALSDILCGLVAPTLGEATLDGHPFAGRGVRAARAAGVGAISEDRLYDGVAPTLSVADNLLAAIYHRPPQSRRGWIDAPQGSALVSRLIDMFGIVGRSARTPVQSLSGGNMQKVVMARELAATPRFLVACQPTRGVDIGAAASLHQHLRMLRDGGAAVLLVSADLDELIALSDRIVVLFRGRIVAHVPAATATPALLGLYMTGLAADPGAQGCLGSDFSTRPRDETAGATAA